MPPSGRRTSADERRWDGAVYQSPRSYASREVIWSRRPETGELFAVFRTMEGRIRLQPGREHRARGVRRRLVRPHGRRARSTRLKRRADGRVRLKPARERRLKQGIRIKLAVNR